MKCKICGIDYHHCTSCDYDMYLSDGYCSHNCYINSDEWKLYSKKIERFYESLNKDQQIELWSLWDNGKII